MALHMKNSFLQEVLDKHNSRTHLDFTLVTEEEPSQLCLKGQRTNIATADFQIHIYLVDIVDYYSPAMMGLKTDQEVLGELVKAKAPAVGQLMAQYPGIWTLVVSRWFICLYIDILPIEVRKGWGLTEETNEHFRMMLKLVILQISVCFAVLADSFACLGLSFLRRIKGSFPCCSNSHHSSPARDPESSLFA